MTVTKVAMLTAGGLAPCLSSSVGGLIERYTEIAPDIELIAYRDGYKGLLQGDSIPVDQETRDRAGVLDQHRLVDPACSAAVMIDEVTTNLTAPIVLTKALLPQLRASQSALVVNLVSALAFAPKDDAACYSATKAGLRMFSTALRAQFPRGELRVLDIFPPLVATAMTEGRGPEIGKGKITAEQAADAIIDAMDGTRDRALIGTARIIAFLSAIAPKLATRLMSK